MLLRDEDIHALLKSDRPLVTDLAADTSADYTKDSPVQSASLDLRVGNIYVPETAPDELGGTQKPKTTHLIEPGHTAVVETREVLALPDDTAAIGFPPSRISARGLLTTNPGHVDAGYSGRLSFTLINMGRVAYEIRRGDVILTLLLFTMTGAARAPYGARVGNAAGSSAVSEDRMSRLSRDFLQIQARAERVAKNEESRTRRWSVVAPALIAALAVAGSLGASFVQNHTELAKEVQRQKTEVAVLRQQLAQRDLEQRVARLENRP